MTDTTTDREHRTAAQIAQYEQDLHAGVIFGRHARSQRSYIGYRPPTPHREYAALLGRLAALARMDDEAAQMVHAIIGKIHLYGCTEEMLASAYEAAAQVLAKGYTDVVALASPEPPRASAVTDKPYSLAVILNTLYAIGGSEGWVAAAIRERDSIWKPQL